MKDCRRPQYQEVDKNWVHKTIQDRLGDEPMNPCTLKSYIEQTEFTICNYINRTYVPEPLKYVFVNLVMDLLKSETLNGMLDNSILGDASIGTLASVKDGDSELKFATSKTASGVHVADVDSLLFNYEKELIKYRIIKW